MSYFNTFQKYFKYSYSVLIGCDVNLKIDDINLCLLKVNDNVLRFVIVLVFPAKFFILLII